MLGPGLAPWATCTLIALPPAFANHSPPPVACTTGVDGSLLPGSREMDTDTCNGLKHPLSPNPHGSADFQLSTVFCIFILLWLSWG